MPSRDSHVEQAEHNNGFWNSLNIAHTEYLDWVVVGMFYEAVHWLEAYLALQDHHSRSHHERAVNIARARALDDDPNVVRDYGVLRVESENARYWNLRHTASQVSSELVPIANRLRCTIQRLLGSTSPSPGRPSD